MERLVGLGDSLSPGGYDPGFPTRRSLVVVRVRPHRLGVTTEVVLILVPINCADDLPGYTLPRMRDLKLRPVCSYETCAMMRG